MNKELQKEVQSIIDEIEILKNKLKEVAKKIDKNRPWKVVLRTELDVVI
jgi:peptidoglycan hydrolase CwlO-like protein